ncbi:hypothetical protein ACFVFH_06450 [Streptomyces sp. NPDC057697]|uniref:hypothetical protein n=1 Tax=Streptomyces sp. NPDC057697 TaxID=3346219 RepID=UPI0036B484F9
MTRLHRIVTVRAPDRERIEAYAGPVRDLVESARVRDRSVVLPAGSAAAGPGESADKPR